MEEASSPRPPLLLSPLEEEALRFLQATPPQEPPLTPEEEEELWAPYGHAQ